MTSQFVMSETEISVTYPDAPNDDPVIWDRLESWCNYRWSETVMEFVVDPPCEIDWVPPYAPFVVDLVNGEAATPDALGSVKLAEKSTVRATIGGAVPSATVLAAYQRLAEYMAATDAAPKGTSRYSISIGDVSESYSRRSDHMGHAMQNSGAADLLRKFRKAGLAHV